ncbi:D-aminoacyl-tRNA deacylase [Thermoflavimicrobium daqui]|jgi:D-tyrosyl-tRNA(Tyr) deacylase|uniref:D-aminoacyl-tRNA deacylase n=1 Tax=Thermoflavimicrobium daqui TaxID=2137476 RepID=A0A364K6A4_9BACL|nr:D-aminoacyl-tRNA deacylase [Thermoflavimicrobium daqui]RAL25742.1 D-tyrosyl-tRNA(Tyr) deacylase [Thermoflavimicrobium daqui]
MKVLLQRVKEAKVTVENEITGAIGHGYLLLVGFTEGDSEKEIDYLAEKIAYLRIFEDEAGKMNRSLLDVKGSILSVSQFTLYGDCRKGRRPNFMAALRPDEAKMLYERFNDKLRTYGLQVETGIFGAMMEVSLVNDGPVTLMLER